MSGTAERPPYCEGERCHHVDCAEEADHKVEEVIDRPVHPLSAYLCHKHFADFMLAKEAKPYWTKLTKNTLPEPGRSYLIRTLSVVPVYDVAFFQGRRSDGALWWVVTNVDIDPGSITHYAEIEEPLE